jgi:uncharacterized repeat protein (TIGR01451 family)
MKKNLTLLLFLIVFGSGKLMAQCVAAFTYNVQPVIPSPVYFINASSGSGTLSYQWDFGDGSYDTTNSPVHTYSANGTYNVCLAISDNLGCTDSVCQLVVINPNHFISITSFFDSLTYFCSAPASEDLYFYGYAMGYQSTDSLTFKIIFGDGTDTTYSEPYITQFQNMITHVYANPGTYTPVLIVSGPDTLADTLAASPILVASTCGNISGTVYQDVNNNCIYDSGDILLSNQSLILYDGTNIVGYAYTDSLGVYSFNVPTGITYTIQMNSYMGYKSHFTFTCPSGGTITTGAPSTGNDFGLSCPSAFDLKGWISGWGFRPGFTASVCVYAYNQYCNTPSGQIVLTFDSALTPLPDSTGTGYTVSGNTVTLNISSPDLYWSFCIPVTVSTNSQIGDSLCIDMNITPTAGDSVPSNNTQTFCFPVRNSWDPNDKSVTPAGIGAQGYIRENTDLTYTIRFQNTGNAEAYNIYILDTLNANVDPASVEVLATSHTMYWSMLTGNILRFNYDNIMLPDSNTSEVASHGYVTYRIKQISNIAQSAQIENSASIYFDFNPPIYTNKTINTIDYFLSVNKPEVSSLLSVYPNPSNDKCHLTFKDNSVRKVVMTDALGKEVFKHTFRLTSLTINTSKFPAGIYSIQVVGDNKIESTSKIVIAH